MSLLLFFDTETTDKDIVWERPSTMPIQPHIVQLAAKLVDSVSRETVSSINLIVKPDGWVIPDKVIEVHGITNEFAHKVGVSETAAVSIFMHLWAQCHIRIAHNTTYDNRIIWIALSRYLPDLVSKEVWKNKELYYCTFQNFKKLVKGKDGHKLKDAYKYFTGNPLVGGHNAMVDVEACQAVYFGILDRQEG